ncbi:LacI family DNA-binding transcriptional regulator [Zhihengliuella flava]|uniref:DNA-binding LacI/PurR family transcriptional regulator n=1 Tax=Zhihengliuella flava TaxID=1285193 RepID=A0A931DAZ2_9MICC|nr:LacI family DNA-binding transcriptional regulator [Zhihengliuella flava]MBG6085258.1 DNA-binding LacI/PurR family transcriptional regulator [Zhihengliuella flava]
MNDSPRASAALGAGSPGATQSDLARELGVSRTLVSLALRDQPGVSADMRARILATAQRRGYRRNGLAADLATRRRTAVGLHLLDARNDIYSTVLRGVQEVVTDAQQRLVLAVDTAPGHPDPRAVDALVEANVGVIISTALTGSKDDAVALNARSPLVALFRHIAGVDSVYPDDAAGTRLALEHLLGLGHRRIAHLTGPAVTGYTTRRDTYVSVMTERGLTPEVIVSDGYSREVAAAAAADLMARPAALRPTAVMTHNDELAFAVREAAFAHGLAVPRDLSVVGYDNSRTAGLTGVELTTVDVDAPAMSHAAARAALRRVAFPAAPCVDQRFEPSLRLRSSTAAPV